MSEPTISADQAIQNAQNAIQRREKLTARHWAEVAVSLAPGREEPWLLMAAIASPLASVGYLNQALKINPQSPRAQAGMKWALKRVDEYKKAAEVVPVLETMPEQPAPASQPEELPAQTEQPIPSLTVPAAAPGPDPQTADTAPIRVPKPGGAKPPVGGVTGQVTKSNRTILLILLPVVCLAVFALAVWGAFPVVAFFSSQFSPVTAVYTPKLESPPTFSLPAGPMASVTPETLTLATTAADAPQLSPTLGPTANSIAEAIIIQTSAPASQPTIASTLSVTTATTTIEPTIALTGEPSIATTTEATPTALPTDTGPYSQAVNQPGDNPGGQAYSGGKRIVVSISEQHMYVYEGDNLVYSFIVSTGIGGSTRAGTFSVLDKIPNAYASTWNLWMPNWMGIYYSGYLENGIHALPILSNGSTLWEGYLGAPVSYGCVVLSTWDSQLLYEWAEVGVPVIIEY